GEETNDAAGAFWRCDVEQAASALADILIEERADVLTCYDDHGGYGHPDHIQVHRVGIRAAELAGTPRVYQSTMNRDAMIRNREKFLAMAAEAGIDLPDPGAVDDFGTAENEITAAVDVTRYAEFKRRAMQAHASQISADSFFLAMPKEAFLATFGTEWFIRSGQGPGITETDLLAGL
ncbi:MAG: GlcNAc-PI de-N-acetylase, partial [Sciscionella sp.]